MQKPNGFDLHCTLIKFHLASKCRKWLLTSCNRILHRTAKGANYGNFTMLVIKSNLICHPYICSILRSNANAAFRMAGKVVMSSCVCVCACVCDACKSRSKANVCTINDIQIFWTCLTTTSSPLIPYIEIEVVRRKLSSRNESKLENYPSRNWEMVHHLRSHTNFTNYIIAANGFFVVAVVVHFTKVWRKFSMHTLKFRNCNSTVYSCL